MNKSINHRHYTYKITHPNGWFYVGRRSFKGDPYKDKYMGSGKWVKSIKDKSILFKTILAEYNSTKELKAAEQELINEYIGQEYCMNYLPSSGGFVSGELHPKYGALRSGNLHHMYGKHHNKYSKIKISDAVRGENNPRSIITEQIAKEIKMLIIDGQTDIDISNFYKIAKHIVRNIRSGKCWKHVLI